MEITAAIITVSDRCSCGQREDQSGPEIERILSGNGIKTVLRKIVPDEKEEIKNAVFESCDEIGCELVITTGGTGFSKRDITPEALKECIERFTPGIDEAMRSESMKITSRGCLSRGVSGIRGNSLIISLPGSVKAVRENLEFIIKPVLHGIEMLRTEGSNDCQDLSKQGNDTNAKPSLDLWLSEAKAQETANKCGMYLSHNGVVRETSKESAYSGNKTEPVKGMKVTPNRKLADFYAEEIRNFPGIYYVRYWLNEGKLKVGDDIMLCLVGGDVRENVIKALETFLSHLKKECIREEEFFD